MTMQKEEHGRMVSRRAHARRGTGYVRKHPMRIVPANERRLVADVVDADRDVMEWPAQVIEAMREQARSNEKAWAERRTGF